MLALVPQRSVDVHAGGYDEEIEVLRQQLQTLQIALTSDDQALREFRQRADRGLWSLDATASGLDGQVPCFAFIKDQEGRYVYVNSTWESVFGFSFTECFGRSDDELWPNRASANRQTTWTAETQPAQTIEVHTSKLGAEHWLVTRFPVNNPAKGVAGLGLNVSERLKVDQALRASDQRFQALFDHVLTGVYRTTADGRLILANPALLRALGYESLQELESQRFHAREFLDAIARGGKIRNVETRWQKKNGEDCIFRETAWAIRDSKDRIRYFEGVVEDITRPAKAADFERDCNRVLEMVARNDSLDSILNEIVLLVERQAVGRSCAFMRAAEGKLRLAAGPNVPYEYATLLAQGIDIVPGETPHGAAAWTKSPVIAANLLEEVRWEKHRAVAMREGIQACWSVPVLSGARDVLGTFSVFRREAQAPEAQDIHRLQRASRLASVAIEHRALYENLRREANYDRLTGLPNRSYFEQRLAGSIPASGEDRKPAVIWIDLDRFNEINDTLGHRIGDDLLKEVAARLGRVAQEGEFLARAGADEFLLLIEDAVSAENAQARAKHLLEALSAPFEVDGFDLFVTASLGISIFPEHGTDPLALGRNSNGAMYCAKGRGKNRYFCYSQDLRVGARERLVLQADLRRAVARGELEMYYQPQVDLQGNLKGMEALLRWNHPTRGLMNPGSFISIAEATGLIVPMGAWAVRDVCRQVTAWRKAGLLNIRVAVNVSALQLHFSDFAEEVRSAMAEANVPAGALEIELTESVIMQNSDQSAVQIQKLRDLGLSISLDDFGTGYSSLNYLQSLAVDQVKIDRSVLEKVPKPPAIAVLRAITTLAHSLGLTVVAEGIEREDQMEALRSLEVDLLQGYLLARPMPATVMAEYLRSFNPQAA